MLFQDKIPADNATLRAAIYSGCIFRLPPSPQSLKAVEHVAGRLSASLGQPIETAHRRLPEQEFLHRMKSLRTSVSDDDFCRDLARGLMKSARFSPDENAFDVLRLRSVMPGGHLNPAFQRAYSVHRDTWYANPQNQVNWWIALHDVPEERAFSFYTSHLGRAVENASARFDYSAWMNAVGWQNTRGQVEAAYPYAVRTPDESERRTFSCKAGDILLFSAAHLHGTNPNKTEACRFSLDFRTVHLEDHRSGKGAPNADNNSSPEALRDYVFPSGFSL